MSEHGDYETRVEVAHRGFLTSRRLAAEVGMSVLMGLVAFLLGAPAWGVWLTFMVAAMNYRTAGLILHLATGNAKLTRNAYENLKRRVDNRSFLP